MPYFTHVLVGLIVLQNSHLWTQLSIQQWLGRTTVGKRDRVKEISGKKKKLEAY